MAVNNEILFIQAWDQLNAAMICCDNGSLEIERLVPILLLADFVSNINTPSRVSECFFTQISFHVKLTFSVLSKTRKHLFFQAVNTAEAVFVTLTTVKQKGHKPFAFSRPLIQ